MSAFIAVIWIKDLSNFLFLSLISFFGDFYHVCVGGCDFLKSFSFFPFLIVLSFTHFHTSSIYLTVCFYLTMYTLIPSSFLKSFFSPLNLPWKLSVLLFCPFFCIISVQFLNFCLILFFQSSVFLISFSSFWDIRS